MKIGVFFNTNQLGGAERSMVETLAFRFSSDQLKFFVPKLERGGNLISFISSKFESPECLEFNIGKMYYAASRSRKMSLLLVVPSLFLSLWHLRKIDLSEIKSVWLNGNKVAVLLACYLKCKRFNGRVYWHLRDYFPMSALMKIILRMTMGLNKVFVANSNSVKCDFMAKTSTEKCLLLYNLPPKVASNEFVKTKVTTLGVASMLTPWKGIHDLLWIIRRNQEELSSLGVKALRIYGDNIYQTNGEHNGYLDQLHEIAKEIKAIDIVFAGLESPDVIMKSIDVLIHSSIKPEPFGRVIVEAMANGLPVISTGIGGAAELVKKSRAWQYYPSHDNSFLEGIREIACSDEAVVKVRNAKEFIVELEDEISKQLTEVLL